jgi:phosphatidylinositol glycan class B
LGLGIVFALGRWVDRWGYGEWVMSPWRYVDFNLLRGEVNHYGQAPIWDVFRMSFTESWPFLGLVLAIASIVAWIRHPRHPLTWSHLPFFVVHEAIAHKELRFFFPIALAGPVLLTMALTSARAGAPRPFIDPADATKGWAKIPIRWFWRFLLANDFIALIALTTLPFSRAVYFYDRVYRLIPPDRREFEILYRGTDPYRLLGNPVYFYRPPALVTREFKRYEDLIPRLDQHDRLWIFEPSFSLPPEASRLAPHCRPAIQTLPGWVTRLDFNGWVERAHPWTLFDCQLEPRAGESARPEP